MRRSWLAKFFRVIDLELAKLLAELERLVAEGALHISRQRQVIDRLASAGLDTTEAESLLQVYEKLQVLHVAHRNRVRTSVEDRLRFDEPGEPGAA
jgi:hypothetical protein